MTTIPCETSEYELVHNTFVHKVYLALTPFIVCIGLLGNILTVCVFILTDLKRQSVSIITIALAIADSFVLLVPVFIMWLGKFLRRELTDDFVFWCRTHGFFDLAFTCCSSWLIVCIAFERFCAVWLPHNNKTIFTHRKTFVFALIIILLSTLSSMWFVFALKLDVRTSSKSSDNTKNVTTMCDVGRPDLYKVMGICSVIINYILPFILVLILNLTVIYRLCQRGIVELTSSITVMLTLVCVVHLVCTLPFQSWWFHYEIGSKRDDCPWMREKFHWRTITYTIRNFNYMANFFLYSCSSKLFRDELKGLIVLWLMPHEKYQNYHYRRQSLYDNMQQQRVSLTQLIMRRLSRTTEVTNGGTAQNAVVTGGILTREPIGNV